MVNDTNEDHYKTIEGFQNPELEVDADFFEPSPPESSTNDSSSDSGIGTSSSSTCQDDDTAREVDVVMTVEELKKLQCKTFTENAMKKVDYFADKCNIRDLYHPFRSSRLYLITMLDTPMCAIVVQGSHRVAALSKNGLIEDEKQFKVFCKLTVVSYELFYSLWQKAEFIDYIFLLTPNTNRSTTPNFVKNIYTASIKENHPRKMVLNNEVQYYMWVFDHLFTQDERSEMMINDDKREAEFKKWFECGTSMRKRRIQKDLLYIFCMPQTSKNEILFLLGQGYKFDQPRTIATLFTMAIINDFETAEQLNAEREKTRRPAALLRAIRKCVMKK